MAITQSELQTIVNTVLSAIKTNARKIDQLTPVSQLTENDNLEVSGGKRISFKNLRDAVLSVWSSQYNAIPLTITLDDLDTFGTDGTILSMYEFMKDTLNTRLRVISSESDKRPIGYVDLFMDSMNHVITEVFTTHLNLNKDGIFDGSHKCDTISTYFRAFNLHSPQLTNPEGTWNDWTMLIDRLGHEELTAFPGDEGKQLQEDLILEVADRKQGDKATLKDAKNYADIEDQKLSNRIDGIEELMDDFADKQDMDEKFRIVGGKLDSLAQTTEDLSQEHGEDLRKVNSHIEGIEEQLGDFADKQDTEIRLESVEGRLTDSEQASINMRDDINANVSAINQEKADRKAADKALQDAIFQEVADRKAEDDKIRGNLWQDITDERTARVNEVTRLEGVISSGDSGVESRLNERIDNLNTAIGGTHDASGRDIGRLELWPFVTVLPANVEPTALTADLLLDKFGVKPGDVVWSDKFKGFSCYKTSGFAGYWGSDDALDDSVVSEGKGQSVVEGTGTVQKWEFTEAEYYGDVYNIKYRRPGRKSLYHQTSDHSLWLWDGSEFRKVADIEELTALRNSLEKLLGQGDVTAVIDTFNEIEAFLQGVTNTSTLTGLLAEQKESVLEEVAGDYQPKGDYVTQEDSQALLKKDGSNGTAAGVSTLINKLATTEAVPSDDDYYVSQHANGGTTTTTYHRRPMARLWDYIKSKANGVFLKLTGGMLTGKLSIKTTNQGEQLEIIRNSETGNATVKYSNSEKLLGYLGICGSAGGYPYQPVFMDSNGISHGIWHTGNDGGGSGLDADLLDGKQPGDLEVSMADRLKSRELTNENLNDIKDTNFSSYYAKTNNTCANRPVNVEGFHLEVVRVANTGIGQILFASASAGNAIFKRYWNASSWSDWVRMVDTNDMASVNQKLGKVLAGVISGHGNWASIPTTAKLVTGSQNGDCTLALNGNIPAGESLHCIIKGACSSGQVLSLTSFANRNVDIYTLKYNEIAELNIIYDGVQYYARIN